MSKYTSISTDSNRYLIKPLDDSGKNYQMWLMRMELILQGGDVWEVVDPSTEGVPKPTTPGQQLDDWVQRDKKVLTQIKCYVSDTALLSLWNKVTAHNAWKALSDCYNSVGAQDTSIITLKLHHFKMDDSKLLEQQINTMHELWYQLASPGGEIPDLNFAMAISEALPPSYDTLKTIAVTNVTNTSVLATETLITQILCEEKCKQHQSGVATMFTKSNKLNCQDSQKPSASKLNTAKSPVICTNPKCRKPGHTFKYCWAEGGGNVDQKKRQWGRCGQSSQSAGAPKESTKVASSSDAKQEMLIAWTNDQPHALLTDGHTCHSEWVVNSRATSHLCGNCDWFTSYHTLDTPCKVILGNKQKALAPRISQIEVNLEVGNFSQLTIIHNILYCPSISHNLLSIPQLTSISAHVQFANKSRHIYGSSKRLITVVELEDSLYRLPVTVVATEKAYVTVIGTTDSANVAHLITASPSLDIWHVCCRRDIGSL